MAKTNARFVKGNACGKLHLSVRRKWKRGKNLANWREKNKLKESTKTEESTPSAETTTENAKSKKKLAAGPYRCCLATDRTVPLLPGHRPDHDEHQSSQRQEEMEQKPVVEMEFVKVDSIKEEVEEETPLAGVQPAAVWQEEMEQKPVVEMEFVKVDSIKEEVEEETPLAGVQPAAVWQISQLSIGPLDMKSLNGQRLDRQG
ncbi:uncharacterized protein LOC134537899 isoform X2 [Bacillus rossius redtenbacheri]|uniref:uncharacterized protein LOC134537899 isoform X2 n=1 Tax=Bacillus rossius redtenbacheri TaxID=93214 RepID=UPI002FDE1186